MSEEEKKEPNRVENLLGIEKPMDFFDVGAAVSEKLTKDAAGEVSVDLTQQKVNAIIDGRSCRVPKLYESRTEAIDPASEAKIVIWRMEEKLPEFVDVEIKLTLNKIPSSASMAQVIQIFSAMDRITRLELTQPNGDGVTVYF